MSIEVTWNGKTIAVDPKTRETQRYILIHELGHYYCGRMLGYQVSITFDAENMHFSTIFEYMPSGLTEIKKYHIFLIIPTNKFVGLWEDVIPNAPLIHDS